MNGGERELQALGTALSSAIDRTTLMMTISEFPSGKYLRVNEAFCRVTGYAADEVLGKTALSLGLIDVEFRQALERELRAHGRIDGLEFEIHRKDGDRRTMRYWSENVMTAEGRLTVGMAEDITPRRQAEEALRVSEARFKAAMEATSDGLWDWDLVHGTGYFSPGYYRMLGYEPGEVEITTERWSSFVHPDDLADAGGAAQACIEGQVERFEVTYRMRAKDGDWRWMLSRGKCVERDARGLGTRLLGTNTDVTGQRKLQMSLAQNERLASMGMLAAGVAHEINNPLAYVLSNLDLLAQELPRILSLTRRSLSALRSQQGEAALAAVLQGGDGPHSLARLDDVLGSVEAALEGTRRIRKISRSLGTFARVERLELEAVDVNAALETAATMAHNEVRFRATLEKALGEVPRVRASDGKLAQVFLNLVINSAHAIPEGHVADHRITLRSWFDEGWVYAEVADTGHGIAKENLERIFEPFFTTKKVGAGSGLGLAISRNIISDFGGELSLESELGRGTRVRVKLPQWAEAPRPAPPPPPSKPEAPAARGRVLVVDDEAAIRKTIARVLEGDHEVVAAGSGREARALLEQDRGFDVVLCDLMMPEMTGMDLHAWLVEADPALAERLVFVSGGAFTPHAAEYLAQVPNVRLEKPFEHAALRDLVRERVKANRRGRPVRPGGES